MRPGPRVPKSGEERAHAQGRERARQNASLENELSSVLFSRSAVAPGAEEGRIEKSAAARARRSPGLSQAGIPPRSPGLLPKFDPRRDAGGSPLASRARSTDSKRQRRKRGRERQREREPNLACSLSPDQRVESFAFARSRLRSPLPPAGWQGTASRGSLWGRKGPGEGSEHQRRGARGGRAIEKKKGGKRAGSEPSLALLGSLGFPCHQIFNSKAGSNAAPRALLTDLDGAAARRRDRAHRGHGPEHGRGHRERRAG